MRTPRFRCNSAVTTTIGLVSAAFLLAGPVSSEEVKATGSRTPLPVVVPGAKVIEGPGFRIEKVQRADSARANSTTPSRVASDKPLTQTFICRAGENLLMSNVSLTSSGTGVVAQRGCRLRIVDSQISAGGIALLVEAGSSVELQNSTLTGRAGSVEAAPNARLAALGASFAGPATLVGADFIDRGGNLWGDTP